MDLLTGGQVIPSDVGTRSGELFLCQQSYGLIADVQEAVEGAAAAPRARWQRWLSYHRAALHHVRSAPPTRFRVVVDGRLVTVDAALVIVANVKTYGAWLPLTPDASPVDGLFDVFVLRGESRRQVFAQLLRRHLRIPGPSADVELAAALWALDRIYWDHAVHGESLRVHQSRLARVASDHLPLVATLRLRSSPAG